MARKLILLIFLSLALTNCTVSPPTARVSEAWVRAADSGLTSAYMVIENPNSQALRLLTIETAVARVVEIHTMRVENEVMFMEPLTDGLEIAAGAALDFEATDIHLMLIDLTGALAMGETIQMTLTFELTNATPLTLTIDVPVLDAAPE